MLFSYVVIHLYSESLLSLSGCCYSTQLKDSHTCVEKAMHHNCPVCFEVKKILKDENDFSRNLKSLLVGSLNNFINLYNLQFLFDTMTDITVLPCGHTIHLECIKEMERYFK